MHMHAIMLSNNAHQSLRLILNEPIDKENIAYLHAPHDS